MHDPVLFATPQVFEQPESDDRLEPENEFFFLVDTGEGNYSSCYLGLIHASATAFLKSWCDNKYVFNSVLKIDVQVDHICISNHNTNRPKFKKPRRALHRWGGVKTRASISYCATCNVNVCIDCYKVFHKKANTTQ